MLQILNIVIQNGLNNVIHTLKLNFYFFVVLPPEAESSGR